MKAVVFLVFLLGMNLIEAQFGQLFIAYYSGISADTVGSGGVNALALAFFDPAGLGQSGCDFSNPSNAPCLRPASGAGGSLNLKWALNVFNQTVHQLSGNTSPKRGGKPTIFFSFGGQTEGGAAWDRIFSSADSAITFGTNAGKLVTSVYKLIGGSCYVGFDLDVEGTTSTLPNMGSFVKAFRAIAPYDTYPLQLCTLSGLADPKQSDHFKVGIMQQYGPAQKGITFLNMMVNNVDSSCTVMSAFWRASALDFLPPANKILGVWGEVLPSWILHGPGCTDGPNPLFTWIKQNGVGIGIWQWWSGATNDISNLINQIRS